MQLYTGNTFEAVSRPVDPDCSAVAELGPGFAAMPEVQSISMIEQTIVSWTPGRAAAVLWLLVQRGARAAWASTFSEANS